MLMFQQLPCVYLHREPVDFHKPINGLAIIVEQQLSLQATDGSVFVFCNKSRDKLKILYWDSTDLRFGTNASNRPNLSGPSRVRMVYEFMSL